MGLSGAGSSCHPPFRARDPKHRALLSRGRLSSEHRKCQQLKQERMLVPQFSWPQIPAQGRGGGRCKQMVAAGPCGSQGRAGASPEGAGLSPALGQALCSGQLFPLIFPPRPAFLSSSVYGWSPQEAEGGVGASSSKPVTGAHGELGRMRANH